MAKSYACLDIQTWLCIIQSIMYGTKVIALRVLHRRITGEKIRPQSDFSVLGNDFLISEPVICVCVCVCVIAT